MASTLRETQTIPSCIRSLNTVVPKPSTQKVIQAQTTKVCAPFPTLLAPIHKACTARESTTEHDFHPGMALRLRGRSSSTAATRSLHDYDDFDSVSSGSLYIPTDKEGEGEDIDQNSGRRKSMPCPSATKLRKGCQRIVTSQKSSPTVDVPHCGCLIASLETMECQLLKYFGFYFAPDLKIVICYEHCRARLGFSYFRLP